jgi:hypothetical protein
MKARYSDLVQVPGRNQILGKHLVLFKCGAFHEIFTRSIEDKDGIFVNIPEYDAVISTSKNITEVYINYRDEGETKE